MKKKIKGYDVFFTGIVIILLLCLAFTTVSIFVSMPTNMNWIFFWPSYILFIVICIIYKIWYAIDNRHCQNIGGEYEERRLDKI